MSVWAACKDAGGANNILPVVQQLSKYLEVQTFATGQAAEIFQAAGMNFTTGKSAAEIRTSPFPEILITSMCCGGGTGRNLIPILRHASPVTKVVALQDFWGARLWTDWAAEKFRPDWITVNDAVGRNLVLSAWPDMNPRQIAVTGYPLLDRYAAIDVSSITQRVRHQLGLTEPKPLVLFGIENFEGGGCALSEFVRVANRDAKPFYLLPAFHPAMKDTAPQEIPVCEQAIAQSRAGQVTDRQGIDTTSLIAASDVVIAMYSTILVEAAVLRKQVIAMLFPKPGMFMFTKDTGGMIHEFPLVTLGAAQKVTTPAELSNALRDSLEVKLRLRSYQERAFPLDGRNTERVVDLVLRLTQQGA